MKSWPGFLLATASAMGAPAESYAIRMAPPVEAGSRYSVSATGHKSAETRVGERVVQALVYDMRFEGRATVVEVDARARPVKVVFTVDRFTKVQAGSETELLPAGTEIVADGRQVPPVTLAPSVFDAFKLVYVAHKPADVTDDDIFGTTERKSIGDQWEMNRQKAVKTFAQLGITVPVEELSGRVSLEGKGKIGEADCLEIRGEMNASGINGTGALAPGVTIESGNFKAKMSGCLPVESRGLFRREGADMQMEMHAAQAETKFDVRYAEKHEVVWTPVER